MTPRTLKVFRRMGFGAAALGAEAVLLWPGEDWTFKPEALVAFLAAVAAWIYLELKEQTDDTLNKAHPNDLNLLTELRTILTEDAITFYRDHDFRTAYSRDFNNAVFEISRWDNVHKEFVDVELQRDLEKVVQVAKDFGEALATHTWVVNGRIDMATTRPDHDSIYDEEGRVHSWYKRRIDTLHELSNNFAKSVDDLFRNAKKRVAGAITEVEAGSS